MRRLHLLNGDCAAAGWQAAGMDGEMLVWRENYLQGALPEAVSREEFRRIRAGELHRLAPEFAETAILTELTAMERTLDGLTAGDELILWFDTCPFDRAMLARVLTLLAEHPDPPRVLWHFRDVVWDEAAFRRYRDAAEPLPPGLPAIGRAAWTAFCRNQAPAATLLAGWEQETW